MRRKSNIFNNSDNIYLMNRWSAKCFKAQTQKYMFFLYYVKSGVENEFEISFVQFDLF